jgi:hypothetical protein
LRRIAILHFDNRTPTPDAGKIIAELFYQELTHRSVKTILPPMPVDYRQLSLEIPLGHRVGGRLPPPKVDPQALRQLLKQLEPSLRLALGLPQRNSPSTAQASDLEGKNIPREIRLTEEEKTRIETSGWKSGPEMLVDGLLVGVISRYRNRQGNPLSVREPASVAYNVYLLSTLDGAVLWQASFDETQVPLFENIMLLDRFVQGKGVWQTHHTLARIGMSRVLETFPGVIHPASPEYPFIDSEPE